MNTMILARKHFRFLAVLLCLMVAAALPLTFTAIRADDLAGRTQRREAVATITYERKDVYAGRLSNSKAAFDLLQAFFDSNPFGKRITFSFLKDVLKSSMRRDQGFVNTPLGFGYGACGAPSLLNQLAHTAMFRDSDGQEKPLFEPRRWTRERNPTYGPHGVAIFLDPSGERSTDYRWRLNPAYDGPPPEIYIDFDERSPRSAVVTMTVIYADEAEAGKSDRPLVPTPAPLVSTPAKGNDRMSK